MSRREPQQQSNQPNQRWLSVLSLSIGKLANAVMSMNQQSRQALYALVQHDKHRVLHPAIDLIGNSGFPHGVPRVEGIETLSSLALHHHDISTRRRAVKKLGKFWPYVLDRQGRNRARATLVEAALSDDVTLRRAAIEALTLPPWLVSTSWGHKTDDDTYDILFSALEDEDMTVRRNAILALGSYEIAEAVPSLIEVLKSNERDLHHAAARALGKLGWAKPIIQALIVAAGPSYTNATRCHAIRALGRQDALSAVPILLDTLTDNSYRLRKEAANALREIARSIWSTEVDAVGALQNALTHQSEIVRCHAARALALAGKASGKEVLHQALNALSGIPNLSREEIEQALAGIR